jgi:hypothetical protein
MNAQQENSEKRPTTGMLMRELSLKEMMTKDDIFRTGKELKARRKSAKVFLEKQAERKQHIWRNVSPWQKK